MNRSIAFSTLKNIGLKLRARKKTKEKDSQDTNGAITGKSSKQDHVVSFSVAAVVHAPKRYAALLLGLFAVWFLGHVGVSAGWLVVGFLIFAMSSHHDDEELTDLTRDTSKPEGGKRYPARVDDMPRWMLFADWQRAEWLNTIIERMWPQLSKFASDWCRAQFAHSVQLLRADLGSQPLRIGSVRSYGVPNMARDEAILDLEVLYCGDAQLQVGVRKLCVGVANVQLHGIVRVTLKPLLSDLPIVGCVAVSFVGQPEIDFDFTHSAQFAHTVGLHHLIRASINRVIDSLLVLPNRFTMQLAVAETIVKAGYLKHPELGVLRVHIIEAANLPAADIGFGGMTKSDPFCEIRVGARSGKTRVIPNNLYPVWNEFFDFASSNKRCQRIEVIVYDADPFDKKEYLGKVSISSTDVAKAFGGVVDKWYDLQDAAQARLHLQLTFFNLSAFPQDLRKPNLSPTELETDQVGGSLFSFTAPKVKAFNFLPRFRLRGVQGYNQRRFVQSNRVPSSVDHTALLYVFVQSVENLPRSLRKFDPKARLKITVENQQVETEAILGRHVQWNAKFYFLVEEPEDTDIVFEVVDERNNGRTIAVGSVSVQLVRNQPQMVWSKPVPLDHYVIYNTDITNLHVFVTLRALVIRPGRSSVVANPRVGLLGSQSTIRDSSSTLNQADFATPTGSSSDQVCESDDPPRFENADVNFDEGNSIGQIKLTLRYIRQKSSLIVVVHECRNLLTCDDLQQSAHAYVTLQLVPGLLSLVQRTAMVKNSESPVFEKTFSMPLSRNSLPFLKLLVTVKNYWGSRQPKVHKRAGAVALRLRRFNLLQTSITAWFDLHPWELQREMQSET